MLVLSRGKNQQLIIGDITITVLEVKNGRARIGIDAPKELAIIRPDAVHKSPINKQTQTPNKD